MLFSVLCLLCLCARLFICALWSPAGKGMTFWLSFVVSSCEFVTFLLAFWVRYDTWLYRFLIFAPLLIFIWNLSSIGLMVSWFLRKLCSNILKGLQYKRPWLKGQPWHLEHIYSLCHIRLNVSREKNDSGFNRFQKIYYFTKNNPLLNAFGSKFDLDVT